MKLELKHLAPYLPYGLRMRFVNKTGREIVLTGITSQGDYGNTITDGKGAMWLESCGFKPILRPISDIVKQEWIYILGFHDTSFEFNTRSIKFTKTIHFGFEGNFEDISKLFENHFDVFGLIDKGLAIDINTIKS